MDDETITAWTAAARLTAADLADSLDEDAWSRPSLCAGWTARDVVAHLTLSTRTGWLDLLPAIVRARGDFDRMEADSARRRACQFTTAELAGQLRETAWSRRRAPGSGRLDPLTDALVHTQDIARPLDIDIAMPADAATAALEHVLGSRFYGARKRFRGIRLVAEDVDWSAGAGESVRGPVSELLMVATGRRAGLAALVGGGVERVRETL